MLRSRGLLLRASRRTNRGGRARKCGCHHSRSLSGVKLVVNCTPVWLPVGNQSAFFGFGSTLCGSAIHALAVRSLRTRLRTREATEYTLVDWLETQVEGGEEECYLGPAEPAATVGCLHPCRHSAIWPGTSSSGNGARRFTIPCRGETRSSISGSDA
jgi:hypothetical protein